MTHSAVLMRSLAVGCLIGILVPSPLLGTQPASIAEGRARAARTPGGDSLRSLNVRLTDAGSIERLVLERFEVFAPDAEIVLHLPGGEQVVQPPANTYLKGQVAQRPGSRAYVVVREDGTVRGLVEDSGRHWVLEGDSITKAEGFFVRSREVEPAVELNHDAMGFSCDTDLLVTPPGVPTPSTGHADPGGAPLKSLAAYTARIAVETDNEFFNKFGNATAATNYVADIIAYGSIIYSAELSTSWLLQHLSLWPPSVADPWSQSNPGCGLYEFGRYWNDNRQGIARTTAAFLSGKTTNSGIAWVGVLCQEAFNVNLGTSCPSLLPSIDNYGGAYAYIGGVDGNFDIDNPAVVWDIVAVTHEIGHNFNSPHTHCYANIGGNSNPIDPCYAGECGKTGCHCGSTALPAGCPGTGNGCGTIMSYCHQLYPGMGNLSLTLGLNHPYGIEPERVPERMFSHVSSRAASFPGCLDYTVADMIFDDGFEDSDTDAWSSTVP